VSVAADVLVSNFEINARYIHDMSIDKFAQGVVWTRGRGADMNMDHHKAQNYATLWTDINLGELSYCDNAWTSCACAYVSSCVQLLVACTLVQHPSYDLNPCRVRTQVPVRAHLIQAEVLPVDCMRVHSQLSGISEPTAACQATLVIVTWRMAATVLT
jgi:hypothetical protein